MPINTNNPELQDLSVVTGKGSIPTATAVTGTLSSSGTRVTGTGTKFLSEFREGDYLFNSTAATNPAVREVLHILSDTVMVISSAFPADVSGISALRVRGKYRAVGIVNSGAATGKLNEGDLASGSSVTVNAPNIGYVAKPISYNATGTTFNIIPTL
jgi:hypothetical protein